MENVETQLKGVVIKMNAKSEEVKNDFRSEIQMEDG